MSLCSYTAPTAASLIQSGQTYDGGWGKAPGVPECHSVNEILNTNLENLNELKSLIELATS